MQRTLIAGVGMPQRIVLAPKSHDRRLVMIAHVSIPASRPQDTALFLAGLVGGVAFEFPVVPGAWIAVAADHSGVAIEVYPPTMAHHPGIGEVERGVNPDGPRTMPWEDQIFADGQQVSPTAFHLALTTHLPQEQILALAQARGWRALSCDRGGAFRVIEVWIDNTVLVEVLIGNAGFAVETLEYFCFRHFPQKHRTDGHEFLTLTARKSLA